MSKKSVQVLKTGSDFARSRQKTLIVTGSSRGGTSMVAAVIRGLGVHMGAGLNNNHEDIDFYRTLNDPILDAIRFHNIIMKRNQQFEVWGAKSPLFVDNQVLMELLPAFRNLVLIVVFRNPLANALSYQARDGASLGESVLSIYEKLNQFLKTALRLEINLVGVNYEAAAQEPLAFVRELSDCIGLTVSPDQIETAIQGISGDGGGYVNLPGERWSATRLTLGNDGTVAGQRIELHIDFQSVIHSQRSFVFLGDIFDGRLNLISYTPAHAALLGTQLRLEFHPVVDKLGYGNAAQYNIYLDLDGTLSLGVSFLVETSDTIVSYAINSERPIRCFALGLSSAADVGRQMPAVHITASIPSAVVAADV